MAKFLCLYNNKGGVGKTTLCINLMYNVAELKDKKTILVDLDNQGDSSRFVDYETEKNLFHVMNEEISPVQAIKATRYKNLDCIWIGKQSVSGLSRTEAQQKLSETWNYLDENYDYVIVDLPPCLSDFNRAVFSMTDGIIVPLVPDEYSLNGFLNVVDEVKQNGGTVSGLLISRYNKRNAYHRAFVAQIKSANVANVYDCIPVKESIQNSVWKKQTVYEYYKRANEQFAALADQLINNL